MVMMNLRDLMETKKTNGSKSQQCNECPYVERTFIPSYLAGTDVVIVGEAGGKTEAVQKKPFVGESGQLLRKLLNEVGFDSDKVTYVNTVKCHPPDNEQPHKKAQELCTKLYLFNELQDLRPKLTILAGAVALNTFFPGESIMAKAGSFLKDGYGNTFLPVLHPAYCLRNQTSTPRLRRDLKRGFEYLNGGVKVGSKKYIVIENEQQLVLMVKELLSYDALSFDVETNGKVDVMDPELQLWTLGLSGEYGKAYSFPLDHPEQENIAFREACWDAARTLMGSKVKKVAHNATFDIECLWKFSIPVENFWADTMVMAFLLDENRRELGLKTLTAEYLESYVYSWSRNLRELATYNCEDASNTIGLYAKFAGEIQKFPKLWKLLIEVVSPVLLVIAEMESTGIDINQEVSKNISIDLNKKLEAITDLIYEEYPSANGVLMTSPAQLSKLMFEVLGFPKGKKTKTGYSTDASVLEDLAQKGYNFCSYLLKIRTYEKLLTTYVDKLPKIVKCDGRIHGSFNPCGTITGRFSSSEPNMQNIPRDKTIKRMFVAPQGYLLMNADASQAELRVGCSIANEKNMIRAYQGGVDVHILTAANLLNKELDKVTKEDRQKAKSTNFGFLYGASAQGFQVTAKKEYGVNLDLDTCMVFRKKWFGMYPGFDEWYTWSKKQVCKHGYVEFPTGRMRRFPEWKGTKFNDFPGDIFRQAVNNQVQGSSADIISYTMVALRRAIIKYRIDAKILVTVHDSVLLKCKEDQISDVAEELKSIATLSIPKQFPWLKVPMVFDYAIGPSWGDLKEQKS